ncbi:hypothetical protein [Natronorubrum sp. FCH18a]|uniref:hypothetical protein n=1 Tax=Natronorubrum sp. FCH18a TaxID=3447018 RepID=UPI003F519D4C
MTVEALITELLEEQPDEKLLLFTECRDTLNYLLKFAQDEPWADDILCVGWRIRYRN